MIPAPIVPSRISDPIWVTKRYTGYTDHPCEQRMCLVAGLYVDRMDPALHSYRRDDQLVEIDAFIADIIVELNERRFLTYYCCSGLPEDHAGSKEAVKMGLIPTIGYIQFALGGEPPDEMVPNGVSRIWGRNHWVFDYRPKISRRQWGELAVTLGVGR